LNLTSNKVTWGGDVTSQKQGSNSIGTLKVENTMLIGFCTNSNPKVNIDNKNEIFITGANSSGVNFIKIIFNPTDPTTLPVNTGTYTLTFEATITNLDSPFTPIEKFIITGIELVVTA
jgi:hypothetical protein